ncbi:MAG: L-rhamnose mutarotase [Draconibacterium sp.]|nr:L-rhamnose mutarotase [Draconibacterium sp.]
MRKIIALLILSIFTAYGCCEKEAAQKDEKKIKRYGWVIKVKPEKLEYYKDLHANPWPEVNAMLKECNIQNYSIYYRDGLLFSYLEYTGDNFDADMKKMAADPMTQKWWKETDPCQEPVDSAEEGVWWADMEEVYHLN